MMATDRDEMARRALTNAATAGDLAMVVRRPSSIVGRRATTGAIERASLLFSSLIH